MFKMLNFKVTPNGTVTATNVFLDHKLVLLPHLLIDRDYLNDIQWKHKWKTKKNILRVPHLYMICMHECLRMNGENEGTVGVNCINNKKQIKSTIVIYDFMYARMSSNEWI